MGKLASYRRLHNFSQSDLANKSGVSVRTIQAYEQGRKDLNKASNEILFKLANSLKVEINDLLDDAYLLDKEKLQKSIVVGMGYVGKALYNFLKSRNVSVDSFDIKDIMEKSFIGFDSVFICVPTNYDGAKKNLDVSIVESVISDVLKDNNDADIFIKSTLPIGASSRLAKKFKFKRIFYVPEFLREKNSDYDIRHPYRMVIGTEDKNMNGISKYLSLYPSNIEKIITGYKEAEAIKLFSNSMLATRIALFNEIDTFSSLNGINSKDVIKGVSLDPRIGDYYNKPSYGYGGYCLPKDTKALSNTSGLDLVASTERSNLNRKKYIVSLVLEKIREIDEPIVGIYHINTRQSPLIEIIDVLSKLNVSIVIYEPTFKDENYRGFKLILSKKDFVEMSDVILSESYSDLSSDKLLAF